MTRGMVGFAVLVVCLFAGVCVGEYVELPPLPYAYNALEPYISTEIMTLHHDKHHAAYTTKLNEAIATIKSSGAPDEIKNQIPIIPARLLRNLTKMNELLTPYVDAKVLNKLRNNLGGFVNHKFFWDVMTADRDANLIGPLIAAALNENFGSFDEFKKRWEEACTDAFGSAWVWLVYDLNDGKLFLTSSKDQDSPLSWRQETLLGIDLWEHAYYLQYKNVRPTYVSQFWNVVNWRVVESNLLAAVALRAQVLSGARKSAGGLAGVGEDSSIAH